MASLKNLQKQLVKLNEDDLKVVLQFLSEEEEIVVEEEPKVVIEEQPKIEKVEPQYATIDDIQGLLDKFKLDFVPKEELAKVQEEVVKTTKKAIPFGTDVSPEVSQNKQTKKTTQDYLNMINQKQ
jgi:hypothetical protein